uniref:Transposase n=1 Tax=Anisakis simplex TaxID=6269 RepID=A0A0M3J876_ANISI
LKKTKRKVIRLQQRKTTRKKIRKKSRRRRKRRVLRSHNFTELSARNLKL